MVVRTTDAQGVDDSSRDFRTEFHLPRVIELDTDANAVGGTVSVVGKGFKNGKQVTVFLDVNGDGILQTEESIVTTATVEGNDTFPTSFVVDSRFTGNSSDDRINAVDGEGNSVCSYSYGSAGLCNQSGITGEALGEFFPDPVVLVDPSSGAPGSEFNITLRDFPANDAVVSVIPGGVEVLSPTGNKLTGTTDAQGGLTLRAEVPNLPTEGLHRLSVFTAGSEFDTNFTVTSANWA